MTKAQFIAAVEAKPNFIKWAQSPIAIETVGTIEKHRGIAHITTQDGTNLFQVFFIHDTATGEASWQNQDTLEPEKNTLAAKENAIRTYMQANFLNKWRVVWINIEGNCAEMEVFTGAGPLTRGKVLVFKSGASLTHAIIS